MTGAYNHFIYTIVLQCCTKISEFTYNRAGRPPTQPAQRACSSESGACTSMTSSSSPGSSQVEHKVERSESDCRLSKVRGCSSSIMDAHSCDHLRGSISGSASPCPCVLSPGSASGFDSPHPSTSSCSLSSKRGGVYAHHPPPASAHAHHPPPASPHPGLPKRIHQSRPGGGRSRAPRCGPPLGWRGAQSSPTRPPFSLPPAKIVGNPTGRTTPPRPWWDRMPGCSLQIRGHAPCRDRSLHHR